MLYRASTSPSSIRWSPMASFDFEKRKREEQKKKKKNAIRKGARGRGSWEEGGKREKHFRPPRALFTLFTVTSSRSYTLKAPPPSSSFVYKPPVGLFFFFQVLSFISPFIHPLLFRLYSRHSFQHTANKNK